MLYRDWKVDRMSDNNEIEINDLGRVEYLNLMHRYYIVIAQGEEYLDHLYDCHFFDDNGDIMEGYEGFWFNERLFLLMEKYFFIPIDDECNLLINMYEEEYAEPEILPKVLEIVNRQLMNCDNDEAFELGNQLRDVIVKAIEVNSPVGFCF